MSLYTSLLTSKNNFISIKSEDPKIVDHFNAPNSFGKYIINQINTDRFYDKMFEGKSDMTILDIGGNVGLFSLYAQDSCAKIYPIEPTPDHFYILNELTKGYDNIYPQNVALHNGRGEIDFFLHYGNTTMNSTFNQTEYKIKVKAKSLLNLCEDLGITRCDFAKVDIEGSEMFALTNETVGEVRDIIDSWFVEVHATNSDWYSSTTENRQILANIFKNNGYKVELYKDDGIYVTR